MREADAPEGMPGTQAGAGAGGGAERDAAARAEVPTQPGESEPSRPFRRREVFLLAATALAVGLFLLFETRLPPFGATQTVSQHVVFFLLINLNIVLILLVVFLLGRNLTKLLVERRQRVLGSHLRTRLVGGFAAVAIAPAVLLFLVALGFIRTSIESWFSVQVEGALEGSLDMADAYYRESMAEALHEAQTLAGRLASSRRRDAEATLVAEKQREWNAATIAVYDAALDPVASASAPSLADAFRKPPDRGFLERVRDEREVSASVDAAGGDLLRAGARIDAPDGSLRGVVVVDEVVPGSVVRRRDEIEQSFRQYKQLKLLRRPLINNYVLTLLLASLVVLFGGTWLGFTLARSITGPIRRLAEGARRVAAGNLDEPIPAGDGTDELSALVEDFNRMTDRLRTTRGELVERTRTLEAILGDISAGVLSIDPEGRIDTVNPAARMLLGIDERVRGLPFREVFAADRFERVRELLLALEARAREGVLDRLQPQRFSVEYDDDGALEIVASGVVLRGEGDRSIGALLFFEDVTELIGVQRMEAWREVARRIAHEIKNPLTPIQLSAQRLRKRYASIPDGAVLDECTRTIVAQVEVLKNLVSEFSHFARLPKGARVPTDLNVLVEEVLVLFREARADVRFVFRRDASLPLLDVDRDGIRRVLTNLVDNAVASILSPARAARTPGASATAGRTGGSGAAAGAPADAGASAEPRGTVEVVTRHAPDRKLVLLEIADDGLGMTAEVKARLFEPYFSTKPDGTGLGLAIVQAVLADHQAFVRVRDNLPRGSRFAIEFPVRERQAAIPASVPA